MKKTIGYVLSHTHWDREWYLSFQLFRMRLVDMLDTLIPYLEQHPEFPHFHLDGQPGALPSAPGMSCRIYNASLRSLFCAISAAALRWRSALAAARRLDICRISFLIRHRCRRSSPGMASARL